MNLSKETPMRKTLILGAALALASSLAAAQGYGQGRGMMGEGMMGGGMMGGHGQGMMGGQGPGMMGGHGQGGGMFAALNLNDEQREKIAAIREAQRKKNWATMGEVRSEQFKLRGLYGADKLDADKIAEQQKKVDELRRQMLKSRVETHNQIAAALTPEQRKQLRQFAPGWLSGEE
jgi:Spy/CpxP family protein refolding chaperone